MSHVHKGSGDGLKLKDYAFDLDNKLDEYEDDDRKKEKGNTLPCASLNISSQHWLPQNWLPQNWLAQNHLCLCFVVYSMFVLCMFLSCALNFLQIKQTLGF